MEEFKKHLNDPSYITYLNDYNQIKGLNIQNENIEIFRLAELFAIGVFSDLDSLTREIREMEEKASSNEEKIKNKASSLLPLTQDQISKLRILTICTIALEIKSPISHDLLAQKLNLETDESIEELIIKGAKMGAFKAKINQYSRTVIFTDVYVRDGSDRTPEALRINLTKLIEKLAEVTKRLQNSNEKKRNENEKLLKQIQ